MARVIGLGISEDKTSGDLLNAADFVAYPGLDKLEQRVFSIRKKRSAELFTPFEFLSVPVFSFSDKNLVDAFPEICIREQEIFDESRAYDIVYSQEKVAMNFTAGFLELSPWKSGSNGNAKKMAENYKILKAKMHEDRLVMGFPSTESSTGKKGNPTKVLEFIKIAGACKIPLSVDLDSLAAAAKNQKLDFSKVWAKITDLPVSVIKFSDESVDTLLPVICQSFRNGELQDLRAVLYKGGKSAVLEKIAQTLGKAGATLIRDALSADYYFAEWKTFKHTGIFKKTQYVYHALNNIHSYATDYCLDKMKVLEEKKALFNSSDLHEENCGACIEPGARVHPLAEIGSGVIIKAGAWVEAGAVIEAGAFIGENVYVSEGARISGGMIADHVFIGKNVKIEGQATVIKNQVYLDDNVKLVRNSVVENRVYANEGCVLDGATLGNSVILEKDCQILPGGYIRKDTIFGRGVVFRSEAKNTVVMDAEKVFDAASGKEVYAGSESGHYGYLGDSILGKLVNEGAGDKNSNVKNDWGEVNGNIDGWKFRSGLCKFGAIIGDYTTVGCLTVLEPASLIGKACNVYGAKYRGFLQTASVFAEEQKGRQRHSSAIPRPKGALEGRSEPALKVIEEFEKMGIQRIGE